MTWRTSIRETLLRFLFANPRPLDKSAFQRAYRSLFPCEDEFVSFLTTHDDQELTQIAAHIVMNLAFHHYSPPPCALLTNLQAEQEANLADRDDHGYIPRDHFVHIVHLYLLGIYFFSYHSTLHAACSSALFSQRRNCPSRLPAHFNQYELFSVFWGQFALYHDLGYPLERAKPHERESTANGRWLEPFRHVPDLVDNDLAYRCLARLVALRSLVDDENNSTLAEMLTDHIRGLSTDDVTDILTRLNAWDHARYIPSLTGRGELTLLLAFIPEAQICAYLERTDTGEPYLVVTGGSHPDVVVLTDRLPREISRSLDSMVDMALSEGLTPASKYKWQYFGVDVGQVFRKKLENVIGKPYNDFEEIYRNLSAVNEFRTIQVKNQHSAEQLGALAYHMLCRQYGSNMHPQADDGPYSGINSVLTAFNQGLSDAIPGIPKLLADTLAKCLEDSLADKHKDVKGILKQGTGAEAVERLLELIGFKEQRFVTDFAIRAGQSLEKNLRSPVILRRRTHEWLEIIFKKVNKSASVCRVAEANPFAGLSIGHSLTAKELCERSHCLLDQAERRIRARDFPGVQHLVEKYVPTWVANSEEYEPKSTFIDHGFSSGFVALIAAREYSSVLESVEHPDTSERIRRLIRLAFGIPSEAQHRVALFERSLLESAVAETVLLHNLYTDGFQGEDDRRRLLTRINRQPLTYLALLADGLQKWDRRYLVLQSRNHLGQFIPGSYYDIRIENDCFLISLLGRRLDMQAAEKDLRGGLRKYLKDADSIIRLQLAETQ